jgi:uncharacterized membrane-anchored protein
MWWFIIYALVAYAVFTINYFYISNSYADEDLSCVQLLFIATGSLIIGLIWILLPIIIIIYQICKTKIKK